MYCGQPLEALAGGPQGVEGTDAPDKAERAVALLDSLTPKARSMMPAKVLAKLEADAAGGQVPDPLVVAPALIPVQTSEPGLVFAATGSRRERGPPPVPKVVPKSVSGSIEDLPSHSVADLSPANEEEGRGSFEALMLDALGRGGGPFGPRKAPWRLMLLPSPRYREGIPWLRARLARTVGIDLYSATQHLQKLLPTCLSVADTGDSLGASLEKLQDTLLDVAVLQRREWARGRLPRLVADIVDLDEDPLLFTLQGGESVEVPRRTIHSALLAEIKPIRDAVQVEKNRFGIAKKQQAPSLEDRFSPYIALDLLLDDDPRPLRLRSSELDFSELLGERLQIAATLNMRQMVKQLAPPERSVPINEGFRRVPILPGPQERKDGGGLNPGTVSRRAVDFTEFSLLAALSLHPL